MNTTAVWLFRKLGPSEKRVDPNHSEHIATGGVVTPLVREAIQNSLDATIDGKNCEVRFTVGKVDKAELLTFFGGLEPHLSAVRKKGWLPKLDGTKWVSFLAVEDFNTSGLTGDPRQMVKDAIGDENHFYRFWRSVGGRDAKRRGSWGIGKVAFRNASQTATFFGLTLRVGDPDPLLMGEADLMIHKLDGDQSDYDWYGYFADWQKVDAHDVAMPIRDAAVCDKFSRTFLLTRNREPGLSVIVPYVSEEVSADKLAATVIEQYFLPILAGKLSVIVRDPQEVRIDKSTIEAVAKRVCSTRSDMVAVLHLAQWQLSLSPNQYIDIQLGLPDDPFGIGEQSFLRGDFKQISDSFAKNEQLAFRIAVPVRPRAAAAVRENIRVILQRDLSLTRSSVPHLRSGITIADLATKSGSGIRGLVLVGADGEEEQGPLDKLLQASEGPSHRTWEVRGEAYNKAKNDYHDAHKIIQFMKNVAKSLAQCLSTLTDARDYRLLAEFFPDTALDGRSDIADGEREATDVEAPGLPDDTPPDSPPPDGVVEGRVRRLAGGLQAVPDADVRLAQTADPDAPVGITKTDASGQFRFSFALPGEYRISAEHQKWGTAAAMATVTAGTGTRVSLILAQPTNKMFSRKLLADGFAIQGNADFKGELRPVKVKLSYAAWGGVKKFSDADFSLKDMEITLSGVAADRRDDAIAAANVLQFNPVRADFYVEVRGFDPNRALHVDARTIEPQAAESDV